jgi:GAF domain-containing protein
MTDSSSNSSPGGQQVQNHNRTQGDYYTALYQAALAFSDSLDLNEVLPSVVKSITDAMQVKGCSLRLLDPRTGKLPLVAVYGLSSDYIAKGPVQLANSPIDSEALGGTCVIIPDIENDSRFQYKEAAKREGIVSVLCVPLEVRGEAIGVLRVYTSEPRTFQENDIQFLSVLASLAALAISNANLYESLKYAYDGVMDVLWGNSIHSA